MNLPDGSIAPAVRLVRQGADKSLTVLRSSEIAYDQNFTFQVRDIQWGAGPLFAKLRILLSPRVQNGDIVEYVYRIPRHGAWFSQTSLFYPDDANTAEVVGTNRQSLLRGKLTLGEGDEILPIPAGLRERTRTVFNFSNDAIVNKKAGVSLMMVPAVQMATRGIKRDGDGVVNFVGCPDFLRRADSGSRSLRAFMAEARFVFSSATDVETLWREHRRYFQPLTAIVDEPAATPEAFAALARSVADQYRQVKNWSGGPEARAVLFHYQNDKPNVELVLRGIRGDVNSLMPTQEAIDAAWKKWQGAGLLDPYTITYSRSALVPMSKWVQLDEFIDSFTTDLAQASRLANGRVTEHGWPHIKCFANAVNMQVGTYLCGVYGGRKTKNADLVKWSLDATQNQSFHGIYGHGQRPYSMNVGDKDPSDQLYMSVTDLWLRAIELVNNEDLNLHPMLYGRYTDCIDVNADLYQRLPPGAKESKQGYYRAAMMRGQAHDHRWENFAVDPYLSMFQRAGEGARVGITEACYWLQRDIGLTMTWNNLMTNVFVPDTLLKHSLRRYEPAPRPPLPTDLTVSNDGGGTKLTWKAPAETATVRGYRVYRATQIGGPWTWLNSPYAAMPAFVPPTNQQRQATTQPSLGKTYQLKIPAIPDTLVRDLAYTDPKPPPGAVYFVTSEDTAGRESRWFPDEPRP